jgi:hypothetical protein
MIKVCKLVKLCKWWYLNDVLIFNFDCYDDDSVIILDCDSHGISCLNIDLCLLNVGKWKYEKLVELCKCWGV